MYVILNGLNEVVGFEDRNLPLVELANEAYHHLYIKVDSFNGIEYGAVYDSETGTFSKNEPVDKPVTTEDLINILLGIEVEHE